MEKRGKNGAAMRWSSNDIKLINRPACAPVQSYKMNHQIKKLTFTQTFDLSTFATVRWAPAYWLPNGSLWYLLAPFGTSQEGSLTKVRQKNNVTTFLTTSALETSRKPYDSWITRATFLVTRLYQRNFKKFLNEKKASPLGTHQRSKMNFEKNPPKIKSFS